jgi:hypothetical protein
VDSPLKAEEPVATRQRDRLPLAAGLDVGAVVFFVAAGRRTHEQDPGIAGLVETSAPFLLGLLGAWIVARAWRSPESLPTGLVVWPLTVLFGMLLRNLVFDDGTALSFVIVTIGFLGLTLIGWRAVVALIDRRRARA